ncbi:MAG: VWA domain-containing protein, partial [Elusimicrobia bacterium]|nr:VWA domain-containing protein [Elusimicrobiota bacterium]
LKKEVAAELSAVLAFSALQNNDKVGSFLFTEEIERHVPAKKGRRHVLHLIRDVLAYEPRRRGTRLSPVLDTINRVLKRRCIVFLISDFRLEEAAGPAFEKALKLSALKHDVIPVVIADPREERLPPLGAWLDLEDPETGARLLLNGRDRSALEAARLKEAARLSALERLFRLYGLDWIRVTAGTSYIDPVVRFFHRRARRLRH